LDGVVGSQTEMEIAGCESTVICELSYACEGPKYMLPVMLDCVN